MIYKTLADIEEIYLKNLLSKIAGRYCDNERNLYRAQTMAKAADTTPNDKKAYFYKSAEARLFYLIQDLEILKDSFEKIADMYLIIDSI